VKYPTLIVLCTAALLPDRASGQVQLTVPHASFQPKEQIVATVTNRGKTAVSYCVEFGQHSPKDDSTENSPIPFYVERLRGKWTVLLIGPDIGSARRTVTLEAGKSHEFPFRLLDTGKMRLVLHYWAGERDDVCSEPTKGRKTATSPEFSVVKE
jgi:hypothetical protein